MFHIPSAEENIIMKMPQKIQILTKEKMYLSLAQSNKINLNPPIYYYPAKINFQMKQKVRFTNHDLNGLLYRGFGQEMCLYDNINYIVKVCTTQQNFQTYN